MDMAKKGWILDKVAETPSYIKELKDFELEEVGLMIKHIRSGLIHDLAMIKAANPESPEYFTHAMFPGIARMEFLQEKLNTELERRGGVVVAPKSKPAPPPAEPLPAFDDAISDKAKLPELWEALALMEDPFLTSEGYVIGGAKARKHREIMALAQVITAPLMGGRHQFEVYSMLCKRVGLNESKRAGRLSEKPGYDAIRRNIITATVNVRK